MDLSLTPFKCKALNPVYLGLGCFLFLSVKSESEVIQSCPTVCDLMDCM